MNKQMGKGEAIPYSSMPTNTCKKKMAEIKNHHLVTIIEKVDTGRKIQINKRKMLT